jgi:DNA polymerase eta
MNESDEHRYIILIDMDAYYAQVEMKKHNLPRDKPMAVQQWNAIIALNYAAKDRGVTRSMTVYDALAVCPDITFVHVSTFEVCEYKPEAKEIFGDKLVDQSKLKQHRPMGMMPNNVMTQVVKEHVPSKQRESDLLNLSSDSEEDMVG